MSEDLKQLKELAVAAMQGQWEMVDQGGQFGLRVYSGYQGFFNKQRPNAKCTEEVTHTCKFIGAADPQTVLALIERIEALTATQAPSAPVAREVPSPIPLFERKLADLQQRGYEVIGRILHKDGEYALFDSSCRWLTKPQYLRLMHEQNSSLFAEPPPPSTLAQQVAGAQQQETPNQKETNV